MDNESENIKAPVAAGPSPATDNQPEPRQRRPWAVACVIGGLVATVAAWLALMMYPTASLWAGVAALALSVAGLWVGRGCLRDICITSIVASGVLVLVHILFTWGLDYTIRSL